MSSDAEAHGGSSFCALASVVLMNNLNSALTDRQIQVSYNLWMGFLVSARERVHFWVHVCVGVCMYVFSSFYMLACVHKKVYIHSHCRPLQDLKRWLCFRQANGFQGRANKPVDCCYSFWVGASLKLLDAFQLATLQSNAKFTLSCQVRRWAWVEMGMIIG